MHPLIRSAMLVGLISAVIIGCSDVKCGPGTELVGSVCVPVASHHDAGASDAGAETHDAGQTENVDQYVSFGISTNDRIPRVDDILTIPVGGVISLRMIGELRGYGYPVRSAQFEVIQSEELVRLVSRDGTACVVGLRPGQPIIKATVQTRNGPRTAETVLSIEGNFDGTLVAMTTGEAPFLDRTVDFETQPPATLPTDLSARVLVQLHWSRSMPGGYVYAARATVHKRDIRIVVTKGAATVDNDGLVSSNTSGTVDLAVTFTPESTTLVSPETTAQVIFVQEVPPSGLCLTFGGACLHSDRPASSVTPINFEVEDRMVVSLSEGTPSPKLYAAVAHRSNGTSYLRWVDVGDLDVRVHGETSVFALQSDGSLAWQTPGVALWIGSTAGFDAPLLISSHFPYSVASELTIRAEPQTLNYQIPGTPGCDEVGYFVIETGGERALTNLESLVVRRSKDSTNSGTLSYSSDILIGSPSPRHYCAPGARYMDVTSPVQGVIELRFLSITGELPFTVTF